MQTLDSQTFKTHDATSYDAVTERLSSPLAALMISLAAIKPSDAVLAAPEKVESLRQEFFDQCRAVQSRGGNLVYPFAAFYVVAQKHG